MYRDLVISLGDWGEGSCVSAIIIVFYVSCDWWTVWTVKFDWHQVSSYREWRNILWVFWLDHEGGRGEVYEPAWSPRRFEVVTDWPQRSPFLLYCEQQREFLEVLVFMCLPLVHGSPFLSLVMTVKVDLCPTFARLNPGPSAHDSIGNTSLVVTWPSLAIALESCSSLEENSTTYRETVDFWILVWSLG